MVPDDWPLISFVGAVAVLISVVGIFTALSLAPWFSLLDHPLSDLGTPGRPSAPVFNWALITSGTLGFSFVAAHWRRTVITVRRGGIFLFGISSTFVVLIGVFPTPHPYHYAVAVGFYLTLTFALFVHGTGDVIAGRTWFGLLTIWLGIIHTAGWFAWWLLFDSQGIVVPEAIGAGAFSIWVCGMVWRRYQGQSPSAVNV